MIYPENIRDFSSIRYNEIFFPGEIFFGLKKNPNARENPEDIESKRLELFKELEVSFSIILDYAKGLNKSTLSNINFSYFFEINSNKRLSKLAYWIGSTLKIFQEQDEILKKILSSKMLAILKLVSEDLNFSNCFFKELENQDSSLKIFLRLHLFKKLQESKNKEFKIECLKSLFSLSLIHEILENLKLLKTENDLTKNLDVEVKEDYLISILLPKMKTFSDFNKIHIDTNQLLVNTEIFYAEEVLKTSLQESKSLLSFLINDSLAQAFIKNEYALDLESALREEISQLEILKSELAINEILIQQTDNLKDANKLYEKNLHLRHEVLRKITSLKETEKMIILAKAKHYL
jgi:hypothetical protein